MSDGGNLKSSTPVERGALHKGVAPVLTRVGSSFLLRMR
jgi:hypothetical protein